MTEEFGREVQEEGMPVGMPSPSDVFPPDIALLLGEIEREPLPERLLVLARKLQLALAERRSAVEAGDKVNP